MQHASRKTAIDAKCRDCTHDPIEPGTWREQVALCSATYCPLHPFRPLPRAIVKDGRPCPAALAALRARLSGRPTESPLP